MIGLAAERGLSGVVTQTCKVMGMRALKEDRFVYNVYFDYTAEVCYSETLRNGQKVSL